MKSFTLYISNKVGDSSNCQYPIKVEVTPELIMNEVPVEMDKTDAKRYQKFKKEIDAINAASLSNKLLQMANGSVYDEDKASHTIHDKKTECIR